jgi:serine/threonine-protein kinase
MILALTHTLISRSVLVPSTFRRTLWISAVCAAPVAAVIVLRGPTLLPEASPERVRTFVVFSTLWCAAAVAAAALNSKTIYGLRKKLHEVGKLGQYTLEEKIGEGGMGVVYRATHAMLRRRAAILGHGRGSRCTTAHGR